jgi:hypothetical protein
MATFAGLTLPQPSPRGFLGRLLRIAGAAVCATAALYVVRLALDPKVFAEPYYAEQAEIAGSVPEVVRAIWLMGTAALIMTVLVRRWVTRTSGRLLRRGPLVAASSSRRSCRGSRTTGRAARARRSWR